jgi:HK97 family phage prohead protease
VSLLIKGYAALFNILDLGNDIIHPGAFRETKSLPSFYFSHRPDRRIGQLLSLTQDHTGLLITAELDDPRLFHVTAGGLSFGYRALDFTRERNIRHLLDIQLFEVSLVTHPMQPTARAYAI